MTRIDAVVPRATRTMSPSSTTRNTGGMKTQKQPHAEGRKMALSPRVRPCVAEQTVQRKTTGDLATARHTTSGAVVHAERGATARATASSRNVMSSTGWLRASRRCSTRHVCALSMKCHVKVPTATNGPTTMKTTTKRPRTAQRAARQTAPTAGKSGHKATTKRVERVLRAGPAGTAQQHCTPVTKAIGVIMSSSATEMAHATLLRLNVSDGTSWIAVSVIAGRETSARTMPPEAYEDWSASRYAVSTLAILEVEHRCKRVERTKNVPFFHFLIWGYYPHVYCSLLRRLVRSVVRVLRLSEDCQRFSLISS